MLKVFGYLFENDVFNFIRIFDLNSFVETLCLVEEYVND